MRGLDWNGTPEIISLPKQRRKNERERVEHPGTSKKQIFDESRTLIDKDQRPKSKMELFIT
jgi:hypothetical protein